MRSAILLLAGASSCLVEGHGEISVSVAPSSMTSDAFTTSDGWRVDFSAVYFSLSSLEITDRRGEAQRVSGVFAGHEYTTSIVYAEVESGLIPIVVELAPPSPGAPGSPASALAEGDASLLVEGTLTRDVKTIEFRWALPVRGRWDCSDEIQTAFDTPVLYEFLIAAERLFVVDPSQHDAYELDPAPEFLGLDAFEAAESDADRVLTQEELEDAGLWSALVERAPTVIVALDDCASLD